MRVLHSTAAFSVGSIRHATARAGLKYAIQSYINWTILKTNSPHFMFFFVKM